ncbi:MAG: Cytochrome c oxidase subunit 3 [candidate division BRC1 bacterium ADurb.BinA364]|nr:MAG: Cytochrome c oxidase subunit 3 [candidate division BRC1 bacterium ADurb.BinA364]
MSDRESPAQPQAVALFAMKLFLVSLTILFVASLIVYLTARVRAAAWPPPGMPRLPAGLWASTVALLLSSAAVEWARRGIRAGRQGALQGGMALAAFLGLAFLALQIMNWVVLTRGQMAVGSNLYSLSFYLLTGLHAAHVVGGLIPLCVVAARSFGGAYSAESHLGVRLIAIYWHFLDIVWLVLFFGVFVVGY